MGTFNNLTGMKFGMWNVLELDRNKIGNSGQKYWICKCECGNIRSVSGVSLRNGRSTSCGCVNKSDISNKIIGKLTVIKRDDEKSRLSGRSYWICKCECGNITSISYDSLIYGNCNSCGCLKRELTSKLKSKYNEVLLYYEFGYGIGFFNSSSDFFIFDIEDLDIIHSRCWCLDGKGYVTSHIKTNSNIHEKMMHRVIMSKYYDISGVLIDHINHNTLDNRKCNLRICNKSENNLNKISSGSNTGYRNIYYRYDGFYEVQFCIDYKRYRKIFKTIDEAIKWRDALINNNDKLSEFIYKDNNSDNFNYIMNPFERKNTNNIKIINPFEILDNGLYRE